MARELLFSALVGRTRTDRRWVALSLLLPSVVACGVDPAPGDLEDQSDINGVDGRLDVAEVASATMRKIAGSTVLLIDASQVMVVGDRRALETRTFQDKESLCEDERFAEQPTAGFCSGSLIGPDLVLTAGHCFEADTTPTEKCKRTAFVFGYSYDDSSEVGKPITVAAGDVYFCATVEAFENDSGDDVDRDQDYAITRLDRAVDGREPLGPRLRREGIVDEDRTLTVIGNPSGLPTKVAGGGRVVDNDGKTMFNTSVDAFGGNSGSIVVSSQGKIEGILVSGGDDFTPDQSSGCNVAIQCKRVDDDPEATRCTGNWVVRSKPVAAALDRILAD